MQLKQFVSDDDAVSPVIGVILMVAITVILAAVIGAFVLGIGGDQAVAPQVSFDVSEEKTGAGEANFTFRHDGGDTINIGDDDLSVQPEPDNGTNYNTDQNRVSGLEGDMSAGESFEVSYDTGNTELESGDELTLIWSPDGSDDTSIIFVHTSTIQPDP